MGQLLHPTDRKHEAQHLHQRKTLGQTKLVALQAGISQWLKNQEGISVGFMQHTSPGAAIVTPIQNLNAPTNQIKIQKKTTLLTTPEQHVTGIVSVLRGKSTPKLRLWSKAVRQETVIPQWHRITQSEHAEIGLLERLGLSEAVSAPLALSAEQTSMIPFNALTFDAFKAIEKLWVTWERHPPLEDPITLELAITPYDNWQTDQKPPEALMKRARQNGRTVRWTIKPSQRPTDLPSPNLAPLLRAHLPTILAGKKSATPQQLALLIYAETLDSTVIVKSTIQADGAMEPLKLNMISRRFTIKAQPSVKFWFDYLPALELAAPHTAFLRALAWHFSADAKEPNTTPVRQLPQAELYLEKPTAKGPAQPLMLGAPNTGASDSELIDVFAAPQAWSLLDHYKGLSQQTADDGRSHKANFTSGDLSRLLSGLTFADAPDLQTDDQPYRHFDPVAFYLPLPPSFSSEDIQALSDRIHGTPAILSLLNNAAAHRSSQFPNTGDDPDSIALFRHTLSRMQQIHRDSTNTAILTFSSLALTPHQQKNSPALRAAPPIRAWLQIPLSRQSTVHKRALANAPLALELELQSHQPLSTKTRSSSPASDLSLAGEQTQQTQQTQRWSWRSFNQQQQESINVDISHQLNSLRGDASWRADQGLRLFVTPAQGLHFPLLDWSEAKLFIQGRLATYNPQVNFPARAQLLNTLEMLHPLMRGSLSDALMEASLFYAQQPPFFGESRQRFPGNALRPPARFSRVSHPRTIRGGDIVYADGCTERSPDSPACANERYIGNPTYTHPTAQCHAQHLVLISDGHAPVNYSQGVARTLIGDPLCHRDSLVKAEQCGRSLAKWLRQEKNSKKPAVRVHALALGARDANSLRYLYDLAQAGQGQYGTAQTAQEVTDFLHRITREARSSAKGLPDCPTE